MEKWKEYNDYLEISTEGRAKKKDFYCFHKDRWGNLTKQLRKGGIIEPYDDGKGYLRFYSKGKHYYIHRMVAEAFIPNPENLPIAHHKDENPRNNKVENLEWRTNEYNINYGTARERAAESHSKKVYQYTLDNKLVKIYDKIKDVTDDGFDKSCVSLCCNGKLKKHKGYKWSLTPL